MTPDFWQDRWQNNQIGFNQARPNSLLTKHFSTLNLTPKSRVFVPLCGKSIDMIWLASQNYEVIGIELVETAVVEFFAESHITPMIESHPSNPNLKFYKGSYGESHESQTITIWVGDFFELVAEDIGPIDAIYDRAALVALPDDGANSLRRRYVQKLIDLTDSAPQLLLNFSVNETNLDESKGFNKQTFGPPFVIEDAAITDYYQATYAIKHLAKETPNDTDVLVNQAWLLTAKK